MYKRVLHHVQCLVIAVISSLLLTTLGLLQGEGFIDFEERGSPLPFLLVSAVRVGSGYNIGLDYPHLLLDFSFFLVVSFLFVYVIRAGVLLHHNTIRCIALGCILTLSSLAYYGRADTTDPEGLFEKRGLPMAFLYVSVGKGPPELTTHYGSSIRAPPKRHSVEYALLVIDIAVASLFCCGVNAILRRRRPVAHNHPR